MEEFMNIRKGDVVVVKFPFSDLTGHKKRPAIVVATLTGNDIILAQITSITRKDGYAITLNKSDFVNGELPYSSNLRPNKLFTADVSLISYKAGVLKRDKVKEVQDKLIKIFAK